VPEALMRWLDGVKVISLRLAALLLAVPFANSPARAQQVDPEGFSICKYEQAALGSCQPLTPATMQSFGLTSNQSALVTMLRHVAANPRRGLPPRLLSKLLATARPFAAVGAFSDCWFPDVTNPTNVGLGVHVLHDRQDGKPQLFQMTYAADGANGHFSVLWNRVLRQ
jgi:hypothetical protein